MIRTHIGPVGMHDDQSPACSAGAGPAYCRREIRPLTQTVTCRQHAGAPGDSGRELGAALAAAAGEDGTAGAGAHAQAEAVRLGAATVVRLEGALAHEVLRRLQGPLRRHDDVGPAPVLGLAMADATAIGKPVEDRVRPAGPGSGPRACERGRRHARSTIREPRNEGQTGGAAERERTKPTIFRGRSAIARRHAAGPQICVRLDCLSCAGACRFSSSRSSPPQCTGCGQTCGQQGIVHRDTDGSKTPDPAHRAPARSESSRDGAECKQK